MSKDTGGPAFPGSCTGNNGMPIWKEGMTLRDYFAAAALQGILACESVEMTYAEFAENSFRLADAMLAERAKP